MADELSVDSARLNAASLRSDDIAETLATGTSSGPPAGSQPSHTGASSFDAALASARARQSTRAGRHASDLRTASAGYTDTDDSAADGLSRSM